MKCLNYFLTHQADYIVRILLKFVEKQTEKLKFIQIRELFGYLKSSYSYQANKYYYCCNGSVYCSLRFDGLLENIRANFVFFLWIVNDKIDWQIATAVKALKTRNALREHKPLPIRRIWISDFRLPDPKRDPDRHQNYIT